MEIEQSIFWRFEPRRSAAIRTRGTTEFINLPFGNIQKLAPFGNAQSHAIYLNNIGCTSIPRLSFRGSPFAIIWFVIAVIINAVQAISAGGRRAEPHIGQEIFEGGKPSLANLDPPASINWIFWVAWVKTSLLHGTPRVIFETLRFVVGSVSDIPAKKIGRRLSSQTATALSHSFVDIGCSRDDGSTAVTSTLPHDIFSFRNSDTLDGYQATKSFPSKLYGCSHIAKHTLEFGINQGRRLWSIQ